MAATIELKYYNSFWLKKIKTITDVVPNSQISGQVTQSGTTITIPSPGLPDEEMNVGQSVKILYTATGPEEYNGFITKKISNTEFEISPEPSPVINDPAATVIFGKIEDFTNIPKEYTGSSASPNEDWYIEEARIRGGYNNTTVDFGVKAYAVDASKEAETRSNALIYSGVYNSRTGINNTNQFSVADNITKGVDPAYGSIQKLYAEDTNLIIFQENKVSRALIDKDAIYSAEGGGTVTSANVVIGQIVPYAGEYGISTNPESFAVYGYRKYFTDRRRNAVLRLSMDGIEEISRYGMTDFFRDTFNSMSASGKIIGGYDLHTKKYEVSILRLGQYTYEPAEQAYNGNLYKTLSFDESVKGWTSFYTYGPDYLGSLKNKFYSFKQGKIYEHYDNNNTRGTFYDFNAPATVTFIFNPNVSTVKNFKTVNYEGTAGWVVSEITTNEDTGGYIGYYMPNTDQASLENSLFSNNFIRKEDKYFANIKNSTPQSNGEIVFGKSMTGLKGFFATVTMAIGEGPTQFKELFAVSTEYSQSSY
jgi:hypothetical protein